ncbi:acyltransferase [Filimonas effusa]|uniref:Acyltransferase n=1 Tax=Filimonas effusa TaxID=2508721 RepID=A0A4Q1DCZ0_9BACT|nr:acyltransferase [Filimonas effusa]RXK87347.1 acyltransferase [Filimonas effusa]
MLNERTFATILIKVIKVIRIKGAFFFPTLVCKLTLYLNGCPYGSGLRACGKVYLRANKKNSIKLGQNVTLMARYLTNSVGIPAPIMIECIGGGRVQIGNYSGLSSTVISSRASVDIGNNVQVGANVRIYDHDFHSLNYVRRRKGGGDQLNIKSSPVVIGDDVFIGTNAIILKGVSIGARSIVAAGSVVSLKLIPADSLVAGNPARIIRSNINVDI